MPNRMVRDWTDSEKINSLSSHAERLFIRLIMKADDFGCFYADPRLLKAHLFPLQLDAVRETDISRWITECEKAGLIVIYKANTKMYLEIKEFGQRLRAKKRKFPEMTDICQSYDGHMTAECPPEEKRREVEENVESGGHFFELFKRAALSTIPDDVLRAEIGKFRNKYPDVTPKESGPLVNAWVSRIIPAKKHISDFI